jgi:hypothetical protein
MKNHRLKILVVFTALLGMAFTQNNEEECSKKIKVNGKVMHTRAFCGGMRMPDDAWNEFKKPLPLGKKKLYVKKGGTNDFSKATILEFTSDSVGNFSFLLPPGDYCIIDEFKKDKKNFDDICTKYKTETKFYGAVDTVCLKGWFETPDLTFTVTKTGMKDLEIIFNDKCPWQAIPCVMYKGPLPP